MEFELPERGIVYWPVSNGDSTTIVIDPETVVQVDLHHMQKSEENEEPTWAIIDELVDRLPKKNGRPYLSAFALTHPDEDHCRGFEKLLAEIDIGELWFTPRIFREYNKELCSDATAFRTEAKRRVKATTAASGDPGAGDRVRVFGYHALLEEELYENLPDDRLIVPGNELTVVDEVEVVEKFRAFVHSPFKDDQDGERNDTSLGLQVTLFEGNVPLRALLFGDLKYPTLKRIFDVSKDENLAWNVLLAPHHCSKSAMFWQDEGDDEEKLKTDILDQMEAAAESTNYIVSSSRPVPSSNEKGDNPPHAAAKKRYEGITDAFLCTMEHTNEEEPEPVVFQFEDGAVKFAGTVPLVKSASVAAAAAMGSNQPPTDAVTYG